MGAYIHHLDSWLETFPPERVHIVDGTNLVDRPWEELAKVEAFLGLESVIGRQEAFYFNETRGFYCLTIPKYRRS